MEIEIPRQVNILATEITIETNEETLKYFLSKLLGESIQEINLEILEEGITILRSLLETSPETNGTTTNEKISQIEGLEAISTLQKEQESQTFNQALEAICNLFTPYN